jgi:hypothetical protein
VAEPEGQPSFDPGRKIDLAATVPGASGRTLAWRRLDANAEGLADLTAMVAGDPRHAVYAYVPVNSPSEQSARLVVETHSSLRVWLNGKEVISSGPTQLMSAPREVDVTLPKGLSTLLIRLTGGGRPAGQASIVTTFVSGQPVSFSGDEPSLSVR